MKFYDTHFDDYITSNNTISLHPKLSKAYEKFPENLHDLKNMVFYGPKGVGKYTQMLSAIKKVQPNRTQVRKENKYSV